MYIFQFLSYLKFSISSNIIAISIYIALAKSTANSLSYKCTVKSFVLRCIDNTNLLAIAFNGILVIILWYSGANNNILPHFIAEPWIIFYSQKINITFCCNITHQFLQCILLSPNLDYFFFLLQTLFCLASSE